MDAATQFVKDIIQQMWDGSYEVDGAWLQDEAAKRGFLVEVAYNPAVHGDIDDVDPGEPVCVFCDRLKSRPTPSPDSARPEGDRAVDGMSPP